MNNILYGPNGAPISSKPRADSSMFGKGPLTGEVAAGWDGSNTRAFSMLASQLKLQFNSSRLTLTDFRLMKEHYQINASLTVLTFLLHQASWKIEGGTEPVRKHVEENMRKIWTRLIRAIGHSFWAGFCVTPETPILCSDMVWRSAGSLKVGQEILAFDEDRPEKDPGRQIFSDRRRFRTAVIERNDPIVKSCIRISTDTGGDTMATDDHPWLVWRKNGRSKRVLSKAKGELVTEQWDGLVWVETRDLREGDKIAYFHQPWEEDQKKSAGWLAGIFDGEGWLSRHEEKDRLVPAWKLGIAQNPGPVLDRIRAELSARGFSFTEREQSNRGPCVTLVISGGWHEILRFLGTIRPMRLLERLPQMLADRPVMQLNRNYSFATVENVEQAGRTTVASITTSAGTFITNGYFSHNSPNALQWENEGDKVMLSKVKDLLPEECEVAWKEVRGVAKRPNAYSIPPKIKVFDGIKQHGYPQIPVSNSFFYSLLKEHGNMYGRKLLVPAVQPWYFSTLMHLYANRYFERFAEPTPMGRAPFDDVIEIEGQQVRGNVLMANLLNMMRNGNSITLPNSRTPDAYKGESTYDYDISYLESQLRGVDFERYMIRLDEEISLAIFTPLLMLRTSDVGSYNLGAIHTNLYLWILNALCGDIEEHIHRYIIAPMTRYNFGEKAEVPRLVFRKMGITDKDTMRSIVTSMITNAKVRPDIEELGEAIGLRLVEIEELLDPDDPNADTEDTGGGTGGGTEDDNVEQTPAEKKRDKRIGRPERTDEPKGLDKVKTVASRIRARVDQQVERAFEDGRFGTGWQPSLGFRKQFVEAAADCGSVMGAVAYTQAEQAITTMSLEAAQAFSGPDEYKQAVSALLDMAVDKTMST